MAASVQKHSLRPAVRRARIANGVARILQVLRLAKGGCVMRTPLILLAALLVPACALGQPYVTAKIAYASAELPLGAPFNGTIDDNSAGVGVDVGFGFGRRWAVELGAARYGSFDGRGTPCVEGDVCILVIRPVSGNDLTVYKAALVPHFEIGDVQLFGRVGYYRANIDANIGLQGSDFDEDGLLAGVGLRWHFADPWSVSLEASRFDDNVRQLAVGFGWGLRPFDD
jgi:hypothetical protein